MGKRSLKSYIRIAIPLVLLFVFALILFFPDRVPFLQITHASSAGLGSESFAVRGTDLGSIMLVMKKVPAGIAPGGCNDIPGLTVVDVPFLLGETEVTGALWFTVAGRAEKKGYQFYGKAYSGKKALTPVEGVSWRDAIIWCNALSEDLGLPPAYYADASWTVPVRSVFALEGSGEAVFLNSGSTGFRLPSSDEWELAARYIDGSVWNNGTHPSGSDRVYMEQSWSDGYAVYDHGESSPVRTLASNALGLYDLSGNVWEWCFDRIRVTGSATEPDPDGKRVVRGGSWIGNAYRLQIGGEFGTLPGAIERGQGFRVARSGW